MRCVFVAAVAGLLAVTTVVAEPLRLLTIGNSFADNATDDLPGLAEAGGKELRLVKANIGGASLEVHVARLRAAREGDPKGYAYGGTRTDPATGAQRRSTLIEMLESDAWDVVTIQQVSFKSYLPETYQPYADELIAAIRQHAPTAEIVVHETWAYREDSPMFQRKDAPITARGMYAGLSRSYRELADSRGLRLLPVGDAFELARRSPRWTYRADPNFNFESPAPGTLPEQSGSLNGGWHWAKPKDGGPEQLKLDANHANAAGRHLGACVWYLELFGEDKVPESYQPKAVSPEDAADLRRHAEAAVEAERARRGRVMAAGAAAAAAAR